jgi:hypothetical protein
MNDESGSSNKARTEGFWPLGKMASKHLRARNAGVEEYL